MCSNSGIDSNGHIIGEVQKPTLQLLLVWHSSPKLGVPECVAPLLKKVEIDTSFTERVGLSYSPFVVCSTSQTREMDACPGISQAAVIALICTRLQVRGVVAHWGMEG